MPSITKIVDAINEVIRTEAQNESAFQKIQLYGIAQPILTSADSGEVVEPGVVDDREDHTLMVYDDRAHLAIYHRSKSKTYTTEAPGFGNGTQRRFVQDMGMIVMGNRSELKMSPETLEQVLASYIPSRLSKEETTALKMGTLFFDVTGANLDPMAVFRQEIQGKPYRLSEENILLEIRYRITGVIRSGCVRINDCDCSDT